MNFIETQQREATEDFYSMAKDIREYGEFPVTLEKHLEGYFLKRTNQTITNTLNHILESGLLEEKEEHQDWCKLTGELEYSSCGCWKDHNTLARAVKAHLDELINPTK